MFTLHSGFSVELSFLVFNYIPNYTIRDLVTKYEKHSTFLPSGKKAYAGTLEV